MTITYLLTVGLSSLCRGLLLGRLCGFFLERKYSTPVTYFVMVCSSVLFGYLPLVGYFFSAGVLLLSTVLYYLTLLGTILLLYRNSFITKIGYFCLSLLGIQFGQFAAAAVSVFLPAEIIAIINDPTLISSPVSLDFLILCASVIISFLVTYLVCSIFLWIYGRVRFQREFPKDSWFILVIASQFILLFFFLMVIFHEGQLYGRQDTSIWIALVIAIVLCVAADVFLFHTLKEMDRKAELETRVKLMEQSQLSDYEQYRTVDSLYRQERIFRHDINNKLTAAENLLTSGKTEQASQLLQELGAHIATYRRTDYCENALINTVLNSKLGYAKSKGITEKANMEIGELSILQTDLCSLFSNILDNAIEACERLPQETEKQISLTGYVKNGYLVVSCQNTALPNAEQAANLPAKNDSSRAHGWGLEILKQVTEKYEGQLTTEYNEGIFSLQAVLKACREA